jgi:hypothetical protein
VFSKAKKPNQPKDILKSPSTEADKKKIRHQKRTKAFSTYIFKIIKQVHSRIGITTKKNEFNGFIFC